jgi:hypothetical protein
LDGDSKECFTQVDKAAAPQMRGRLAARGSRNIIEG